MALFIIREQSSTDRRAVQGVLMIIALVVIPTTSGYTPRGALTFLTQS